MKKGRKLSLTPDQVRRLKDKKAAGMKCNEIAKVMGLSTGTISAYLRGERG